MWPCGAGAPARHLRFQSELLPSFVSVTNEHARQICFQSGISSRRAVFAGEEPVLSEVEGAPAPHLSGARGLCTGGAADGYAFSTESPSPVVKSLRDGLMTEMQKSSKHYVIVLRRLKPNWYLFYQADR